MTDITELVQSLKAAANTTTDAIDRLKAFPSDELIDLSQHEGEQVDIDIATLNQWYELSSPANIIALVEALEKAQAQSSKWLEAYHKAVSIGARYEERIAELESRTVKLPEPFELAGLSGGASYYHADEVDAALIVAGIKVETE